MATKAKSKTASTNRPRVNATSTLRRGLTACRATVPAGYGFPTSPRGMLDWGWAREHLAESHNYVIVTVRPDGRPHAMGMRGLWIDDAYYFGSDPATRKARNLAVDPHCILINEKAGRTGDRRGSCGISGLL